MNHYKKYIIALLITYFVSNTTFILSQKMGENKSSYDQINQEIETLHKNITELASQHRKMLNSNKLRVSIGLGLHDIIEDNNKYIYRNDVFFYFSGEKKPMSMKIFYEQVNSVSFLTEVRIIDIPNLLQTAPFSIQISYASWSINQERQDQVRVIDLVRFTDNIVYPPGASITKYSVESIEKPKDKYKFLLNYRNIIKKIERTMILFIKSSESKRKQIIEKSLKLGKH